VVCRSLNLLFLRSMFAHVISMRLEESLQWSFVYKFHVYQNTSCRSTCSSFLCTYRSWLEHVSNFFPYMQTLCNHCAAGAQTTGWSRPMFGIDMVLPLTFIDCTILLL
jgi:hypothetical protein